MTETQLITHRYRLNLTRRQHAIMANILEQQRQLYNAALAERIGAYRASAQGWSTAPEARARRAPLGRVRSLRSTIDASGKTQRRPIPGGRLVVHGIMISNAEQARGLTQVRADDPAFADVPRRIQRWTLNAVEAAYKGMFNRVRKGGKFGHPRFRGFDYWKTFGLDSPRNMVFDGKRLRLTAKHSVGGLRIHKAHTMPAWHTVRTVTFSRRAGIWYVQVAFERPIKTPRTRPRAPIGIAVGSLVLAATSDSHFYGATRAQSAAWDAELRRASRAVSRCKTRSEGRRKRKLDLQRLHRRITNRRDALLEKTSAELVKHHDAIAVKALAAREPIHSSGRNVQARGIRRAYHDRAWGLLLKKIEWKCQREGRQFITVDHRRLSQDCSACGTTVYKLISQRLHICDTCDQRLDCDVNAARNILVRAGWGPGQHNAHHEHTYAYGVRAAGNTASGNAGPDHVEPSSISCPRKQG